MTEQEITKKAKDLLKQLKNLTYGDIYEITFDMREIAKNKAVLL